MATTAAQTLAGLPAQGKQSRWLGRAAMAGMGLAGLVFGGFPLWAARRILYPVHAEPLDQSLKHKLEIANGVAAEYAEYDARDGKKLSGWFVPAPDTVPKPQPCILLVYGYGGYKEQMVGYAQILHDAGFATFMFDMQGSGLRGGEPVTLGYKERWDMMDAARYLLTRPDVDHDRIGALGISMGAATALLAAEEDQTIKAIVSDSSYASLNDMIQPGLRAFVGAPAALFAPIIVWCAETMLGMKSSQVQPVASAARLGDRPIFVIHGADDPLTNAKAADLIYEAASGPRELWVIPDCGHALGPVVAPDEYKARIRAFLRSALNIA